MREDLLLIKGAVTELPPDEQARVHECASKLRALTKEYGDQGVIAFALCALELDDELK